MPNDKKKYLITAITLGLIAAGGALLIAGTNLITRDPIKENEIKTINKGLANIFDIEAAKLNSNLVQFTDLPENVKFDYVVDSYYEVNDESSARLGYALRTEGFNDYGKIILIVGFNAERVYKGVAVVENGQSFASTLNKKYLNPLIKEGKTVEEVDVSCGATYGAKLTRNMINSAVSAAEYLKGANNG